MGRNHRKSEDAEQRELYSLRKTYERSNTLKDFEVDDEVLDFLQNNGFENLLKFGTNLKHNFALISALVSKYDSKNQVFVFGENKEVCLYFGLIDVLHILGLPIGGSYPLICRNSPGEVVAQQLFGNPRIFKVQDGLNMDELKKIATEKNENGAFKYPIEVRTRAVCLYLLGAFVFPHSCDNHVSQAHGPFVMDANSLKSFAWGQAALVEIHHHLKERKKGLGGSMLAVMAFALHHIKPLHMLFNVKIRPKTFPLLHAWAEELYNTLRSSYNKITKEQVLECLDKLQPADIYEHPYSEIEDMPPYYERQRFMGLAILPLFNINRCLFHQPFVCKEQYGVDEDKAKEMEKWLESNWRTKKKDKFIYCAGLQGGQIKNYFDRWKRPLKAEKDDIITIRRKLDTQSWVTIPIEVEQVSEHQKAAMLNFLENPFPLPVGEDENHNEEMAVDDNQTENQSAEVAEEMEVDDNQTPQQVSSEKGSSIQVYKRRGLYLKEKALQNIELELHEIDIKDLSFLEEAPTYKVNFKILKEVVTEHINDLPEDWKVTPNSSGIWSLSKLDLENSMETSNWFSDSRENRGFAFLNTWFFTSTKLSKNKAFLYDDFSFEDIRAATKIFVPIYFQGHWYSMIAHVEEKKIYLLDSVKHDHSYYAQKKEFVGRVLNHLIEKNLEWTFHLVCGLPYQKDYSSCGPLTLKSMQCWAMGYRPSFQEKVDYQIARNFVVWEIARNRAIDSTMYMTEIRKHFKKLLIFDLNGVLLDSEFIKRGSRIDHFRPHYKEFLKLCSTKFRLAIWTSRQQHNSKAILEEMHEDVKDLKFLFVWHQDQCHLTSKSVLGNCYKKIMFKDLSKVWNTYEGYDASNTVLIDDSAYKAYLNPEYTSVIPKTYHWNKAVKEDQDHYLDIKGNFAKKLMELAEAEDVQQYLRENPFGEKAIEDDQERDYYLDAIKHIL